jgi:hypothetical protein
MSIQGERQELEPECIHGEDLVHVDEFGPKLGEVADHTGAPLLHTAIVERTHRRLHGASSLVRAMICEPGESLAASFPNEPDREGNWRLND